MAFVRPVLSSSSRWTPELFTISQRTSFLGATFSQNEMILKRSSSSNSSRNFFPQQEAPKHGQTLQRRNQSDRPLLIPEGHRIPEYMRQVYTFWYMNEKNIPFLDHEEIVNSILWGKAERLENMVTDSIQPGDRVLQAGATYGNLTTKGSKAVGSSGLFDVVDITPIQVALHSEKLQQFPQARVRVGNANEPHIHGEPLYDLSFTFMLLHELPENMKDEVVSAILNSVKVGGKVMFIDYHRPSFLPLHLYLLTIFRVFEPFGFQMMKQNIQEFADPAIASKFEWTKSTIFQDMFQIVTATRKE